MSHLEALLANYESSEEDDRPDLISDLETFFDEERVRSLLLKVIADSAEYDLARIEALRVFEVQQPPQEQRGAVVQAIAQVLGGEPDEVVRQWAGRALKAYSDHPHAVAAAAARALDPQEDLDVRCNCLSVLEVAASEEAKHALAALANDPVMGKYLRTDPE